MPFTPAEAQQRNPDLTARQARVWANAWNEAHRKCMADGPSDENLDQADGDKDKACEIEAFRIANAAARSIDAADNPRGAVAAVRALTEAEHSLLGDVLRSMLFAEVEVETGPANEPEPHAHTALVDSDTGDGVTTVDAGHRHVVSRWQVLMESDHGHDLDRPEGADDPPSPSNPDREARPDLTDDEGGSARFSEDHFRTLLLLADGATADVDVPADDEGLVEGQPQQIAKTGKFRHPQYGEFEITEEMLDQMILNADRLGRDIPFDYDHKSGGQGDHPESGRAAGWVRRLFRKGGKLFAVPAWTKRAFQAIRDREWRYISPEFHTAYEKDDGTKLGPTLLAIAITNKPFLKGMAPIQAGEYARVLALGDDVDDVGPPLFREVENMPRIDIDPTTLGLAEDATEDEIKEALAARLSDEGNGAEDVVRKIAKAVGLELSDDDPIPDDIADQVSAKLESRKASEPEGSNVVRLGDQEFTAKDVRKLQEDAAAGRRAEERLMLREAEDAVRDLVRERKITTEKQREWAKKLYLSDRDEFDAWSETLEPLPELQFAETELGHGDDIDAGDDDTGTHYRGGDGKATKRFMEKVKGVQKEDDVDFSTALQRVRAEHPKLAEAYFAEQRHMQPRVATN